MQRGRVFNISKLHLSEILKKNSYSIICCLFLVLGIILGLSFFEKLKSLENFFEGYFTQYIEARQNAGFLKISFLSYIKFLLLFLGIFISGTTLFGVVTVPLLLTAGGFFYGLAVAYLYSAFALKGVAFNAVIFLPPVIIMMLFLIFASKKSLMCSLYIARLTLPNAFQGDLYSRFKEYSLNYLFLALGLISSSLVDGLISVTLLKFFEF